MEAQQTVLVTGASTGFGRLITDTLARKGHTIFATMRDVSGRNAKTSSEIEAMAKKESLAIHVLELDVTDEASIDRAVQSMVQAAGRIDVAINNAGFAMVGLQEAFTTEQVQRLFDTNFFGPVRVNRAVLPHMRKQRSGLLMHISSGAGRVVFPSFGLYCASKFALEALGESYSYELATQGIESVIVEPGAYNTPIFGNIVTPADPSRADTYGLVRDIPEKVSGGLVSSAGDPQEVADAILRIVETPAGQRKLRYRVFPEGTGPGRGVDEINAACEQVQKNIFDAFGLSPLLQFSKGKAASSV